MAAESPISRQINVLGKEERRQFAFQVVDRAIGIYTTGVVAGIFQVDLIQRWTGWVGQQFPAVMSWEQRHEEIARLLYTAGMRVGGVAVKAMQFVGIRDDLPQGYRQWFAKAQEATHTESPEAHVRKVTSSFPGLHVEFPPVKSASMAQVHFGSWQGRDVAIKVQHPHVREEYETDLAIMRDLGKHVDHYAEARGAAVTLKAIADKLMPTVLAETDFREEAKNQSRVRRAFQVGPAPVEIAEVFDASQEVLVMERLEGLTAAQVQQSWKEGQALDRFGRKQRDAVYMAFATMVLRHGFFQMDAHPGNFMALQDGRVALLDFGQCCQVSDQAQLRAFFRNAPESREDAQDPEATQHWLRQIGVNATVEEAMATADLLLFGQKSPMFPSTESMAPDGVPLLLVLLYLSRFENMAASFRTSLGLEDSQEPMAILRIFKGMAMEIGL